MLNQDNKQAKDATIYRMVMDSHVCPYGIKAKYLLKNKGYKIEDRWLKARDDVDKFKTEHGVKTTPQIFIEGTRIGGYDDLRKYFGKKVADPKTVTYQPVIWLFVIALLMAVSVTFSTVEHSSLMRIAELFVAFSMTILALLKLQNIETFSTMFLNYDLLAKRWVPYSYIYPFAEAVTGILMISKTLNWISIPISILIGTIGAISVIKAVYIDHRELKCACVGGSSNVPLGFISLTENIMMIAMGLWMASSSSGGHF